MKKYYVALTGAMEEVSDEVYDLLTKSDERMRREIKRRKSRLTVDSEAERVYEVPGREFSLDAWMEASGEELADMSVDVEIDVERKQYVAQLLEHLTDDERELVYLMFWREWHTNEIACHFGISRQSVRNRFSAIRQKLQKAKKV